MALSIVLADDHAIVREALRGLLQDAGFTVVAEASDGYAAVDAIRRLHPAVAVLDLSMPVLNGIDAARAVVKEGVATRVVLLTVHREDHYVLAALHAGVTGYVLKTQASADLIDAIRQVVAGRLYISPGISRAAVEAFRSGREIVHDPLSVRERQVLQLIAEGRSTKEIAGVLGLSVKTADSHRTRLMQKLDIHEVAGLVRYAVRMGLVQP